jgi:beta-N-acetylhexosaminidase
VLTCGIVTALVASGCGMAASPRSAPSPGATAPGTETSAGAPEVTVPALTTSDSEGSVAVLASTPAGSQPPSAVPTEPAPSSTGATTPPPARGTTAPGSPPASAGLAVTAADRAKAKAIVTGLSTEDKAASVIMADGKQLVDSDLLTRYHFGGVILMATRGVVDGTTGGTPAEVAAVTKRLRAQAADDPTGLAPLIGTDQEYGDVVRMKYGFTDFPGESGLAAIADTDRAVTLTRQVAAAAAQELLAVGVTVNFAPVSDVLPTDGSASAIGDRSYGSDPQRDAELVAAAVTGYQRAGIVSVLKHFPGLGRVATDTHVALPTLGVSCASWNSHEAVPVRAGIEAGAAMVMTGHVLLPAAGDDAVPASISHDVVTTLLRGSGTGGCTGMDYSGVTVTDSLQMEPIANVYTSGQAAVRALNAGQDLLLMPLDPAAAVRGIVAAVESGSLAARRLDQAATAVLALRIAAARTPRPPMSVIDSAAHQKLAAEVTKAAGGG